MKHRTTGKPGRAWRWTALSALMVLIWLAVGGVGGPTFGKLSEVSSNDQASFLPASAESTEAGEWQAKFSSGDAVPAVVLIESPDKLSAGQLASLAELATLMGDASGVSAAQPSEVQPSGEGREAQPAVIGPIPSADGSAVQFIVSVSSGEGVRETIAELRAVVADFLPAAGLADGTKTYVTGPAGFLADVVAAFGGIDGILLLAALGAVLIILLAVYRSIILPFVVLLTAVFALCASILVVFALAQAGIVQLTGQSQGILSILVVGSATDYGLLFVSRYREALNHVEDKWKSVRRAYKGSFGAILASGVTVALALLCLLFSELNSNRGLGPIGAIGIVFSILASLTLLPALLGLFGRAVFWPRVPRLHRPNAAAADEDITGLWRKLGTLISRRPRAVWIVTAGLLIGCALGLPQLKASGVPQSDLILNQSEAVDGQAALGMHYPAGAGSPVIVVADEAYVDKALELVKSQKGISDAAVLTAGQPAGRPVAASQGSLIREGRVLINATLDFEADSAEAEDAVTQLRASFKGQAPGTLVGGVTATAVDTNASAEADLRRIIPIVLVVILLVLMVLLRAVVAPLLLVITVVLSYMAALGVSALVFNHIFGFPGADASVPLFGFVFLVALGVDYNIFLLTRVREESVIKGTRRGIIRGLGVTGGVITSAGIVLAATFAALGVIPILFLAQISFIVAFGVLLDTTIVRSLLVPALTYDLGRCIWWPGRLGRATAS